MELNPKALKKWYQFEVKEKKFFNIQYMLIKKILKIFCMAIHTKFIALESCANVNFYDKIS